MLVFLIFGKLYMAFFKTSTKILDIYALKKNTEIISLLQCSMTRLPLNYEYTLKHKFFYVTLGFHLLCPKVCVLIYMEYTNKDNVKEDFR